MKPNVKFNLKHLSTLLEGFYFTSQFLAQFLLCDFVGAFKFSESPCGITNLTSVEGIITSPYYPTGYPSEINCEWKIHSPADSTVKLKIVDLDMEQDQPCYEFPCCSRQGLLVPIEGGRGSRLLCGKNLTDGTIFVSQPVTVIKYFSTIPDRGTRGFQISYTIDVRACKSDELECINGKCVSNNSFCNNVDDCGDGSDEKYCPHIIHTSLKYDLNPRKILDIEDYMKSKLCLTGWEPCILSPGHCFLSSQSCDGKFDCPKGEDEIGCVPACPERISCSSGDGCYYPAQRCNLIRNCRDNSDETGCPAVPCSVLQFTCLNGACVSGSQICDGDDDCGDMSDEENCTKSSFLTVAIMGLLSCVFLFCIGLSCLYRVYAAKLRAASFVHQLEPDPIDEFIYREPPPAYSVAVREPNIMPYSTPQFMEGYFESDHIPSLSVRNTYHHRRCNRSQLASTPRSRPRALFPASARVNSTSQLSDTQHEPKINNTSKNDPTPNSSNVELLGFQDSIPQSQPYSQECNLQTRTFYNESPCSSPSLSPSRESFTSSTSLEDHEELVRSCQC